MVLTVSMFLAIANGGVVNALDPPSWKSASGNYFILSTDGSIGIGVNEVSVEEFERFVTETSYTPFIETKNARSGKTWRNTTTSLPVTNVTFVDAVNYCEWISKKEGVTIRLPTVREWEEFAQSEFADQQPTTTFTELDKSEHKYIRHCFGNVREYCDTFATEVARPSHTIGEVGVLVSVRGGAWNSSKEMFEKNKVDYAGIQHTDPLLGFRIVVELK